MAQSLITPTDRSIVHDIEIAAPVSTVWNALTDAQELVRWFPLDALVRPGTGGSIQLSWGYPAIVELAIEIWTPHEQLTLREVVPFGAPFQPPEAASVTRTVDFTFRAGGKGTLLRLVHSGFGTSPAWDDFYNTTSQAWDFQLHALLVYVEHYLGQTRHVAWARSVSNLSPAETWQRVVGPQGLVRTGAVQNLLRGDSYSFVEPGGTPFTGSVLTFQHGKQFAGTVPSGLLRIVSDSCGGVRQASVWQAKYTTTSDAALEASRQITVLEQSWTHTLQRVLQ